MRNGDKFYRTTLLDLLKNNEIRYDSRILVVCGGVLDRDVLAELGFTDVVISNLDVRAVPDAFEPFAWSFQDAENLNFDDESFDFVIVHSGLHHCRSPHKGLLEMYRVARRGVLVFEPLDNLTTRLGVRVGIGQEYELAAVVGNGYRFGGVRNSEIPNYVYRFTEREVVKTISTFAPHTKNRFRFFYAFRMPWDQFKLRNSRMLIAVVAAIYPFAKIFTSVFRRESNNFAFGVLKASPPLGLHPWITLDGGRLAIDRQWVQNEYNRR